MLTIRRVEETDCGLLYTWANDPHVRSNAFSDKVIPWDRHVSWFYMKLHDYRAHMYIGEQGAPIGQIRFDEINDWLEIDFSVASDVRGQGFGTELLRLGVACAMQDSGLTKAVGYVLPENIPSQRAFSKAGYRNLGLVNYMGREAYRFELGTSTD